MVYVLTQKFNKNKVKPNKIILSLSGTLNMLRTVNTPSLTSPASLTARKATS